MTAKQAALNGIAVPTGGAQREQMVSRLIVKLRNTVAERIGAADVGFAGAERCRRRQASA